MKKGKRNAILCCLGLALFAGPAWAESSAREQGPQAEVRRVPASYNIYQYLPEASSRGSEMRLTEMSKEVAGKVYYELQGEGEGLSLAGRIGVVNAVPLSDFKRDTEFGRVMGEYLLTDLADRGLTVTELRLGKEITILPQTGEFLLSRNIGELASKNPALEYAVVSTFSNTRKTLIVQGRLVRLSDGLIKTSWRYTMPLTRELLGLFQAPPVPTRIAIKGFAQ
ncbi:MAG: FlgO family outer membrane protein [Pseudomonadota bacterium]